MCKGTDTSLLVVASLKFQRQCVNFSALTEHSQAMSVPLNCCMEALNSILEHYVILLQDILCSRNSVLALPTCDTEHLQADKRFEGRSSQGAEVISAEVQKGQR